MKGTVFCDMIKISVKWIIGLFLLVLLSFPLPLALGATPEGEDLTAKQEELKRIYAELKKHKEELRLTKEQEQDVLSRLTIINKELQKTEGELTQTQNKLVVNERRVGQLAVSLVEDERQLKLRSEMVSERAKEIYRSGGTEYLELIFSANTLADFINRFYFFERLLGRDIKLVKEISEEHSRVKQNKQQLEEASGEIKVLARLIEKKKDVITSRAEEKKQAYEALKERRKEYERQIAELEASSQQIEQLIRKIIAERSRKGLVAPKGTGVLSWPLVGRITSPFGYRRNPFWGGFQKHTGIDIAGPYGDAIKSADSGEVIFSGWWDGYGKAVIIDHGRGISTVYGHMSRIYVQEGQRVDKSQVVGLVGTTGYSTGPHLHFEVYVGGTRVDPLLYFSNYTAAW